MPFYNSKPSSPKLPCEDSVGSGAGSSSSAFEGSFAHTYPVFVLPGLQCWGYNYEFNISCALSNYTENNVLAPLKHQPPCHFCRKYIWTWSLILFFPRDAVRFLTSFSADGQEATVVPNIRYTLRPLESLELWRYFGERGLKCRSGMRATWRDGWLTGLPCHTDDAVAKWSRFLDEAVLPADLFIALQVWNFWSE